jgi:hypothetical protein
MRNGMLLKNNKESLKQLNLQQKCINIHLWVVMII